MGSPSFYTNTDHLNLAIEVCKYDFDDEQSDYGDEIAFERESMQLFLENDLPTLFFHTLEMNSSYNTNGFQVYIEDCWTNYNDYIATVVSDWNKYKEFSDLKGYYTELQDCPYFNRNAKNITAFSLKAAIQREYKTLHNLLLKKGLELGMGEVVGRAWSSNVHYPIISKLIN